MENRTKESESNFFERWKLSAFVIIFIVVFGIIIFMIESRGITPSPTLTTVPITELYYINSISKCVSAPHNPYSGTDQGMTCSKDVGQICYNDSTCGGVGKSNTIVINQASYRLSTAKELIQNLSTPGFAENARYGNSKGAGSMIAVKGTLTAIFHESGENNNLYDLVINTADGVVVVMQSTTNPDTQASDGFIPSNLSIGNRLIASGVFIGSTNNFNLDILTKSQSSSVPIADSQLASLNLPVNTPILVSGGTNGVQLIAASTSVPVPSPQPTLTPTPTDTTAPSPQPTSTVIDYSQFTPTYFYNFTGDPPAYLGVNIKVKGIINSEFLAAGDKGGSSNYIGVEDPNGRSSEIVMLKISNNAYYQKAVSALQYEDLVAVYGNGGTSEYFTNNAGQKILTPIINIIRIDVIGACGVSGCGESGSVTTIFP